MDPKLTTFVIAMIALNGSVVFLLARVLGGTSFREAMVEKDPAVVEETTRALVASHAATVQALAPALISAAGVRGSVPVAVPDAPTPQDVADALPASYSRIAGAFGAIVLAGALFALANYITWAAFYLPGSIKDVLDKMGNFFIAGSALFAPYAANQLTSIFHRQPTAR
jgi:hypothetical protein